MTSKISLNVLECELTYFDSSIRHTSPYRIPITAKMKIYGFKLRNNCNEIFFCKLFILIFSQSHFESLNAAAGLHGLRVLFIIFCDWENFIFLLSKFSYTMLSTSTKSALSSRHYLVIQRTHYTTTFILRIKML